MVEIGYRYGGGRSVPTAKRCSATNVPSPRPSSTETSLEPVGGDQVGDAIPIDIRHRHRGGLVPTAKRCSAAKVPSPRPSNTETSAEPLRWRSPGQGGHRD